jgi:hypothetical protein
MSENPSPEVKRLSFHVYVKRLKKPFRLSMVGFLLGFSLVIVGDMTRQNASLEQVGNGFWAPQSILTSIGFLLLSVSGIIYFGIIMILAWRTNNPYLYSKVMRRLVIIGGYPRWSDKTNLRMAGFLPLMCVLLFCVLFPRLNQMKGRTSGSVGLHQMPR